MRKPPIKFGASPSEDDENGRRLAKKLEESRRQTSPHSGATDAPAKTPKARPSRISPIAKAGKKAGHATPSEIISIRVSVPSDLEEKSALKALSLGVEPDYLKLTLIDRTRKMLSSGFIPASSGIERKVIDYTLHNPKPSSTWARLTLTLPAGTVDKLRALTNDKLDVHKKSTLVRALFLATLEKTLDDL